MKKTRTKAQLELINQSLSQRVDDQSEAIRKLRAQVNATRAATEILSGPSIKEPETEVGYLRRELAYAQGQLHQAHLTVKQLCGRITTTAPGDHPSHQGATYKACLNDGDLNAIQALTEQVRGLMAHMINQRDYEQVRSIVGRDIQPWVRANREDKSNPNRNPNA